MSLDKPLNTGELLTTTKYVELALVTESLDAYPSLLNRLQFSENYETMRLLHGSMGCVTEAAELLDAMKKFLMYGKPLDRTNVIEEMGDLMWYLAIMADTLGITFEEVMTRNIAKLQVRFGGKFTSEKAIVRDLPKELEALEKS